MKSIMKVLFGSILLATSLTANATLELRLDGQAYYDTDLNITWLKDANAAKGTIYDIEGGHAGQLTWENAMDWSESPNVNSITGWRLQDADINNDGLICLTCLDNELGDLLLMRKYHKLFDQEEDQRGLSLPHG